MTAPMPALALLLASPFGCATGIQALYEEERTAALAHASQVPADWSPDLRIRLGRTAVDGLVQAAVDEGLLSWKKKVQAKGPMGLTATLVPKAHVTDLTLAGSKACDGCLAVDASLKGSAKWSAAGLSGTLPFTAELDAVLSFETARQGDAWDVQGRIRDVSKVRIKAADLQRLDVTPFLGGWVEDALAEVKPVSLGQIGGGDLPLRAARLETRGAVLELALLSDLPTSTPVESGGPASGDWRLRAHQDTLLALARREAFETGPIAYDTAAVPTALTVSDSTFSMDLRLWHLDGAGWWRDYTVDGDLAVRGRKLVLSPTGAEEGEKSKGAGLADPIALLAEGRILDAVEDGLHQAVPVGKGVDIGSRRFVALPATVRGADGVVELTGTISEKQQDGGATPLK